MKFGLIPINVGAPSGEFIIQLAKAAEAEGFESVWTFEHTIVPVDYSSKYPYHRSGKMGAEPETVFVDPLIALAAVAAATERIRLATGVNIVSQTNPLLLAKQCASLDFVSNGRFMLGAGIGWLKEEFAAMGTPFERRGARFDDYMVALKKIWSGDVVEHRSDFIDWSGFKSYPLPVQRPGVPIILGGDSGKIYQRIARYGDGWFIPAATPDRLPGQLSELRAACKAEGRDAGDIELTTIWNPKQGAESLHELENLGIARVLVMTASLRGGPLDGLKAFADDFIR